MKKILTITTLIVVLMGVLAVNVNAVTRKPTNSTSNTTNTTTSSNTTNTTKTNNTTTTTNTTKTTSTSAKTVNAIYEIGTKYGMTTNDKQELQNFIDRNGITDAQVEKLLVKAQEAEKIMVAAGTTDYNKLTTAQKDQVKSIANEAASEIGVSLVFKSKSVEVYKDGKKVLVVTNKNGKLSYTGNRTNIAVIAVSSVAVIALAAVVLKKRTAVAK